MTIRHKPYVKNKCDNLSISKEGNALTILKHMNYQEPHIMRTRKMSVILLINLGAVVGIVSKKAVALMARTKPAVLMIHMAGVV